MNGQTQHVCSTTAFEPFAQTALERSIVDRFAQQVARHHDCVAVVDRGVTLSYGGLDAWTNGIAHSILEHVGGGTDPIALVVGQGAGYAAAVLGTLKSGRPYVPLEPTDPLPRLREFIAESGARIVVADAASREVATAVAADGNVIQVDEISPRETPPTVELGSDAVAYIFFTSGSTGAPKGVFDTHRNVLHNVLRYTNALEIAPTDRLTLLQGPAFSGCVSSQFGALLNGAASFPFRLADEGLIRAAEWLRRERITIYHSVPSILRSIVGHGDAFPTVRVVRLEGDRATSADFDLWKRRFGQDCILANGLGTTETGLARQLVLHHTSSPERGVLPVGHAVRDMTVVVVDPDRKPLPEGEVGEIAVASDYLALGYWKRPDLTAERFESRNGRRVYFTGDLGRLTADGCLEYLGRRKGDVKVLGTRVEPAEVERELLRLDGVSQAAVAVREGAPGDGRLVAYVVPDEDGVPDLATVRAALAERLPSVLLPTTLVELAALPLGPNGKVDRQALPDPPAVRDDPRAVLRRDERWLAEIWSDVLNVGPVGPDDDFFALGGDSLAAAEIVARIELETGRALALAALVRAPTVAALADVLDDEGALGSSSLTTLRAGDGGAPLVLLHGNSGNGLHYAQLVPLLDDSRPLWVLEYAAEDADVAVEAIVSAHVASLSGAGITGPLLLAGFCYGSGIARELGRRLATDGHVVHLALLGVTPLEFPSVVAADAYQQWSQLWGSSPSVRARLRYRARVLRQLPLRERPAYVGARLGSVLARASRRLHSRAAEPIVSRATAAADALAQHRPEPYVGRPLVVMHRDDTDAYSSRPERDWAGLGSDGVELMLVPGGDHAMLETPGAAELARLIDTWATSVATDPR